MAVLDEGDLSFDFKGTVNALKFDQQNKSHPEYHDIPNMFRVDFVVETTDAIYFVEVKDPDHPNAANKQKFLDNVHSGKLVISLINKYLFTFFFRWAEDCLSKKIHYIMLITLETPLLVPIETEMNQLLKLLKKNSQRWVRFPLASCLVLNITTWNTVFPSWPIIRLSTAPTTPQQ